MDYTSLYNDAGNSSDLDPLFLRAQAMVESTENPNLVSPAGAQGLSQIMPQTALKAGLNGTPINPFDPAQAIPAQARIMNTNLNQYKLPDGSPDTVTALMAYNGGPKFNPNNPETRAYPGKVLATYAQLKAQAARATNTSADGSQKANPADVEAAIKQLQDDSAPQEKANPADVDAAIKQLETDFPSEQQKPTAPTPPPADPKAIENWGVPTAPSQTPPATQPATQPAGYQNELGYFDAKGNPIPPPPSSGIGGNLLTDAAHQAVQAMGNTWANSDNHLLTPAGHAILEKWPVVGNALSHYVVPEIDALSDVPGTVMSGAQKFVSTVGDAYSPKLGRDLALGMAIIPAHMGVSGGLGGATVSPSAIIENTKTAIADNALNRAAPLSKDFRANPMTAEVADKITATPAGQPIAVTPDPTSQTVAPSSPNPYVSTATTGGNSSVGAMVNTVTPPNLTPGQEAAYNRVRLNQTATDRATPQGTDNTEYVPGVKPTSAAIHPYGVANPDDAARVQVNNAVAEKTMRATNRQFQTDLDAQNLQNNNIRKDYLADVRQDPIAVENAELARDQLKPDFSGQAPVDAQPIVKLIDQTLASPVGKQEAVTNALTKVRNSLYDANGNLETMPDQLYGARQNLTNMMSKIGQQADPSLRLATGQLQQIKMALDPVINKGAPGFTDYLQKWNEASKPIDAMNALQSYKLSDTQGNLQYSRVQRMLEDIVNKKAAPGVNPQKAITPEQMDALWALRDDLARESHKDEAARVKGSDTTQQLNASGALGSGAIGTAVRGVVDLGGHLISNAIAGPLGNVVYHTGREAWRNNRLQRAQSVHDAKQAARANKMLNPPPN